MTDVNGVFPDLMVSEKGSEQLKSKKILSKGLRKLTHFNFTQKNAVISYQHP